MGIQADIKDAIGGDRDDLVRVLAEHRVLPAVLEQSESGDSSLLGKSSAPTFRLEPRDDDGVAVDRQTTAHVVDALGLDSEADCEAIREEIASHPAW